MRTWTSPSITPLPASGLPLRLHDTRTGRPVPLVPLREGIARLYVCGITPYDSTHMGHAMTYHSADLMRRALLDTGYQVQVAQNITDVDDPLFERADRDGVDWKELAASQVELFAGDMEALRIAAPDTYLSVSEAMDGIIRTVQQLHERGRAYALPATDAAEAEACDWYLDLAADGALGDVSGWNREEMLAVFAERGGDPDRPGKRDPLDPLLWRARREGEPSWDAGELGQGRPGWHVECVCIAEHGLDLPFDVQAGGRDLIFPHHDLSAAHAVALGRPFASLYAHAGMVAYEGTKMSKSLGNLVFVSRLVAEGTDPAAIRLVLLAHHYRSDWEWTAEELERATIRLQAYRARAAQGGAGNQGADGADAAVVEQMRAALRDDLNTPRVLEILDAWAGLEAASEAGHGADSGEGPTGALPENAPADVPAAVDALLGMDLRV